MRMQICERKGVERIIRMVLNLGALTYGLGVAASAIGIKLQMRKQLWKTLDIQTDSSFLYHSLNRLS